VNRRNFLGALAGGAVSVATKLTPTMAQEPEATPNVFVHDFKGANDGASRNWLAVGLRFTGGMKYATTVNIFDSEKNAKKGFGEFEIYLDEYLAAVKSDAPTATWTEPKEISTPDLGENRKAYANILTIDEIAIEMVFYFVQKDKQLYKWFGGGFTNPAEELFDLAKRTMKFEKIDPSSDEELLSLLPTLQDMPEGFTLDNESTYHN